MHCGLLLLGHVSQITTNWATLRFCVDHVRPPGHYLNGQALNEEGTDFLLYSSFFLRTVNVGEAHSDTQRPRHFQM